MMPVLRRAQPWLGTLVEIGLVAYDRNPDSDFASAFAAIERVHRLMSPQHASSDIARFNAACAGTAIPCHDWTLAVLTAARELGAASGEVFDITLGTGGLAGWSLESGKLLKHCDGVRLDLGGIAKGDAVDRACAALQAEGVTAGWVNAGGDLRSFGNFDLPVHVRDPDQPGRTHPLAALRDGAIASSDFSRAAYPASQYRQVTVAAPDCRWADALTKIVSLAPHAAESLLPRYHAQVWTTPHPALVSASQ